MNPPVNVFDNLEAFSEILGLEDLLEGRYDNDENDNPIYIGYTPYPNGDTSEAIWYIRKVVYDGTAIVRTVLPEDGIKFGYVWDDRIDYFPA